MDMKLEIAKSLSAACGVAAEEIAAAIEVPANTDMGDFAYPCFKLAKVLRKAPPLIAQEIGEKLEKPDFIADVKIVGAYINFFMDKHFYTKKVLETVLTEKENYGKSDMGAGKTIVIDYSSPNIAKPFHVGHLRSTVIGNALYQIHSQLGYKCVGVNHLGDWGTQFGKLIVAYKKWGSKEAVEEKGIQELMRIYVKFHDEAEKAPELDDEARLWFVKMQDGDEEAGGSGKAQLDGQGAAQQAGQNPQGDAEVQAASGLDHGDHGQHQNSIQLRRLITLPICILRSAPTMGAIINSSSTNPAIISRGVPKRSIMLWMPLFLSNVLPMMSSLYHLADHQCAKFLRGLARRQNSGNLASRDNGDSVTGLAQLLQLGGDDHHGDAVLPVEPFQRIQHQRLGSHVAPPGRL